MFAPGFCAIYFISTAGFRAVNSLRNVAVGHWYYCRYQTLDARKNPKYADAYQYCIKNPTDTREGRNDTAIHIMSILTRRNPKGRIVLEDLLLPAVAYWLRILGNITACALPFSVNIQLLLSAWTDASVRMVKYCAREKNRSEILTDLHIVEAAP